MFFQVMAKWHNTGKACSLHSSFTPSTYQWHMENSIQASNSLCIFRFLDLTCRKASLFSQMCCPISWQAVSPRRSELFLHSHSMSPSTASSVAPCWHPSASRSSYPCPACVLSMSHPCPAAQPLVPQLWLCQESLLQQPPSPMGAAPGGPRGTCGVWVRDTGCATGVSKNLINCKRVIWEKKK